MILESPRPLITKVLKIAYTTEMMKNPNREEVELV
jgi:hypothetical protein